MIIRGFFSLIGISLSLGLGAINAYAQLLGDTPSKVAAEKQVSTPTLIQPEELVALLRKAGPKPLLLQVGFRVLYQEAHIPGSEYLGPASNSEAIEKLRNRVKHLSRDAAIILYCGCCPWEHCPNVHPAYRELRSLGFSNVKVLYIGQNFGEDWVSKGYPVEKGE